MTTYLESLIENPEQGAIVAPRLKALGEHFDKEVKERRIVSAKELQRLTRAIRAIFAGSASPAKRMENLGDTVAVFLSGPGAGTLAQDHTERTETPDGPAYSVACAPDERLIAYGNQPVRTMYWFDAWLENPRDASWLKTQMAASITRLERNAGAFSGFVVAKKRYGPEGPVRLEGWLSETYHRPVVTVDLATEKVLKPHAKGRLCLLYDLVNTGAGIAAVESAVKRSGGALGGAVLLYAIRGKVTEFPYESIFHTSAERLGQTAATHHSRVARPLPADPSLARVLLRDYFENASPEEFSARAYRTSHGDFGAPFKTQS